MLPRREARLYERKIGLSPNIIRGLIPGPRSYWSGHAIASHTIHIKAAPPLGWSFALCCGRHCHMERRYQSRYHRTRTSPAPLSEPNVQGCKGFAAIVCAHDRQYQNRNARLHRRAKGVGVWWCDVGSRSHFSIRVSARVLLFCVRRQCGRSFPFSYKSAEHSTS